MANPLQFPLPKKPVQIPLPRLLCDCRTAAVSE